MKTGVFLETCHRKEQTTSPSAPQSKPGSRLEANQLEEEQLRTRKHNIVPSQRARHGMHSLPQAAARATAGGQLPLLSCATPWEHQSLSKEWICAAKPNRGWPLWTCLSAFQLWASLFGESESPVAQAARTETPHSLTLSCQEFVCFGTEPCAGSTGETHRGPETCCCPQRACCVAWRRNS